MKLSFFRSLHFRLAAVYAGIFCASVVVLGAIVSITTQNFVLAQLRSPAEYGANQLLGDYYEDGIEELHHDIKERVDADDPERLWYFLVGPDGRSEFDAIKDMPGEGWHEVHNNGHHMLLMVTQLRDGYRLGVGVGLDRLAAVEKAVQRTFFWALLAMIGLAAVGGIVVSKEFLRRMNRFKNATVSFGEGDLSYRIQRDGSHDEFDQLAQTLNAMFERIEALVSEVQRMNSNIAHDLRTPLGRMKQKLESLRDKHELNQAARAEVEDISIALDGTLNTFAALLRIAEVELGTRRSEFKPVEIAKLIESVANAYEAVIEEGGRTAEFLADSGLRVMGDQALLLQALVNLIENAIQHTPGGSAIRVTARTEGADVFIVVCDNGPGIPEDQRQNALKPFYKLDRSRGRTGGGSSGLGLSLVAAVAKLHDARLFVGDNAPGLTVELRIPRL